MHPSSSPPGELRDKRQWAAGRRKEWRIDIRRRKSSMVPAAAVAATVIPLVSLWLTVAVQIRLARRRYGSVAASIGPIDTTVVPAGPEHRDGAPLELVALGDSGMAGVGVDRLVDTLPVMIAFRLAAHTGRSVHVVSHGRSGARTHDVLSEQLALVQRRPDVVVVLVGTNDVTHLTPAPALAGDTASLMSVLNDFGVPVVVSSLPEFRAMRAIPPIVRAILVYEAAGLRKTQRRAVRNRFNVHLVDVRRMVGREFVKDVSTMSADQFHPSAAGYALIADVLAAAVAGYSGPEVAQIDGTTFAGPDPSIPTAAQAPTTR